MLNRGRGLLTRALRLAPRPFFNLIMSHPLWLINCPRMQCVTWAWSAGLWYKLNGWSCQHNPNLGANSRSHSLWQPDSLWNKKNKKKNVEPKPKCTLFFLGSGLNQNKVKRYLAYHPIIKHLSKHEKLHAGRYLRSISSSSLSFPPQWQMDHAVLSRKDKLRIVFTHHLFPSALIWPMLRCVLWNFPVFKQYQVWAFVEANLYSCT